MTDALHTRVLGDGSQTVIRLYIGADHAIVEAENTNGISRTVVDHADALKCFAHPFSRAEWLSYPGTRREATPKPLALNADGIPRIEMQS